MKFKVPTPAQLKAFDDCPECVICCASGLCCPPAAQFVALVALMHKGTGSSLEECAKYAQAIVDARIAALEKHA